MNGSSPSPPPPPPPPSNQLIDAVYAQLRAAAQLHMAGERGSHTLQATALVHEAYLKLAEGRQKPWANAAHFYAAAAEAMRRLLIDHARARNADKRGGGDVARFSEPGSGGLSNVADLASNNADEIVRFDEAFLRLEGENPEAAAVVRLRFFAGLSVDQTAEALGLSAATVDRRWAFARAWLHRRLQEDHT